MSGEIEGYRELMVEPLWVVPRRSTDITVQEDRVVAVVMSFIRDNASRPMQVSDVIRQIGLSRRTVERRFMRVMGHTLNDEITLRHLQVAKQLLVETELSMERVAEAAGFGNPKPMTRAFRKHERQLPSLFRRRHRSTQRKGKSKGIVRMPDIEI